MREFRNSFTIKIGSLIKSANYTYFLNNFIKFYSIFVIFFQFFIRKLKGKNTHLEGDKRKDRVVTGAVNS